MGTERNYTFDVLKIILAFCIVLKHTESMFKVALDPLTTCAVPMFFMTSGWLIFSRPLDKQRILRNSGKMIRIFIYATIFWWIIRCFTKGAYIPNLKDGLILILSNNERVIGHLWYLSAYAYTLLVIAILVNCKFPKKHLWTVPLVLLVVYFVCDTYIVNTAIKKNITLVYLFRNWIFTGVPFFIIGGLISMKNITLSNNITIPLIIIFSTTALCEIHILHPIHIADVFWTTAPLSVILFLFIVSQKIKRPNVLSILGEKYSLYIYIFHPLFCDVLLRDWLKGNNDIYVQSTSPLIVFALSLLMSIIFVVAKDRVSNKLKNFKTITI